MCVVNKNNEDTSSYIPCMHVFLVLLSCFFQVINKMAIFVESCSFFTLFHMILQWPVDNITLLGLFLDLIKCERESEKPNC